MGCRRRYLLVDETRTEYPKALCDLGVFRWLDLRPPAIDEQFDTRNKTGVIGGKE